MNKINKFESYPGFLTWLMALLLVALTAGCGGGSEGRDPILGVGAGVGGAGVGGGGCVPGAIAKTITAYTFPTSTATVINELANTIAVTVPNGTIVTALVATFTTTGTGVPPVRVGTVTQVSGTTANNFTAPVVYTVTAGDCSTRIYTVTVTVAPAAPVASCAGPGPLPLASATNFAVLAGTALTLTNPQVITGDIGTTSTTPAAGPSTHNGTLYDTGAAELAVVAAAVTDMETGVACALGRGCDFNYAGPTNFTTAMGLLPGVHCVVGAMSVGALTFSVPGTYIFRATGSLTSAATITVNYGGAANATNSPVFWVSSGAASAVSIGATNTFLGTVMCAPCAAGAVLGANSTMVPGRLLSSAAVTLNGTNTITIP